MSQNEPFDALYLNAAVTAIVNLDDRSYSVAPEWLYTRVRNVELRLRVFFLHGRVHSDFGEKQNERRIEFRMRYFLLAGSQAVCGVWFPRALPTSCRAGQTQPSCEFGAPQNDLRGDDLKVVPRDGPVHRAPG